MGKPYPVLNQVAYDMMRRLRRELSCDMPPMDESRHGEAWLDIHNGEPLGCVTINMEAGERFLLGAWVRPCSRRQGIMTRLLGAVACKYGSLRAIRPSPAMRNLLALDHHSPESRHVAGVEPT
jgi:hypothetical protein